jgi:glycosyltransferase involved in cell wall biosynthesis
MHPRCSIVTPCFNALGALPRCVGSVRGQVGVACEHLVQDGGSRDGTSEWARQQPDLATISEPDQGMYDAINRGWSRARGDILSWLNADEQYTPGTLARVTEAFDGHTGADVVWGDTLIVGPAGDPIAARREIPLRAAYVKNGFLYALSCSVFFHRRLWDEGLLRFDPAFRLAGDADLVLRLLAAGRRFIKIRGYLGLFGVDGGNLSVVQAERMEAEGRLVRERHRACASALGRRAVLACRHLERIVHGCYRPDTVDYAFALNERPDYRHIRASRIGGRFSYDKQAGGDAP